MPSTAVFKENVIALDDANTSGRDDSGYSPKALLLSGLAGCTGMDVISILDKMKAPFEGLRIEVEAEQTNEHPESIPVKSSCFILSGYPRSMKTK